MNAKTALLDLFFPPKCAFCGRVGVHGTCASCEKTLPRLEIALREGAGFGKCAVPLRYEGAVREALLRFKFRGARSAAPNSSKSRNTAFEILHCSILRVLPQLHLEN